MKRAPFRKRRRIHRRYHSFKEYFTEIWDGRIRRSIRYDNYIPFSIVSL
jgi:hypothetical protein